jgi:hypothetical protein
MTCIEICLKNVWLLKIKSVIGPLFVIGASTLGLGALFAIRSSCDCCKIYGSCDCCKIYGTVAQEWSVAMHLDLVVSRQKFGSTYYKENHFNQLLRMLLAFYQLLAQCT